MMVRCATRQHTLQIRILSKFNHLCVHRSLDTGKASDWRAIANRQD